MTHISRRAFALLAVGAPLAACTNGVGQQGDQIIDARVDKAIDYMFSTYAGTQELAGRAHGMLVMPLITEAGLGFGGSFGEGALRIANSTVDYYSIVSGSAGLQIGVQQLSQVLFFMTPDSLQAFRTSNGWAAGADLEYALLETGDTLRAETTTSLAPVIAVVFAQSGLRLGATLEGSKYTRIIP